jgi:hypothetical protein
MRDGNECSVAVVMVCDRSGVAGGKLLGCLPPFIHRGGGDGQEKQYGACSVSPDSRLFTKLSKTIER